MAKRELPTLKVSLALTTQIFFGVVWRFGYLSLVKFALAVTVESWINFPILWRPPLPELAKPAALLYLALFTSWFFSSAALVWLLDHQGWIKIWRSKNLWKMIGVNAWEFTFLSFPVLAILFVVLDFEFCVTLAKSFLLNLQ